MTELTLTKSETIMQTGMNEEKTQTHGGTRMGGLAAGEARGAEKENVASRQSGFVVARRREEITSDVM